MKPLSLALLALSLTLVAQGADNGNRLTHLASEDPFHPNLQHPRFITPQWIGEEGVEAAVILSIDDLRETKKYEDYLRPILERLKKIDPSRAPFTVFCNKLVPEDPQFQTWLKEGVSLDVHTLTHPCPLFGKEGGFAPAEQTVHGGIDWLAKIPSNRPVAYRMPCCDSMNSLSPRFFAEIFSRPTHEGRFLSIDSSVMCLLTSKDPALPKELVLEEDGKERFRKYFPMEMVPPRKLTFERFAGYIEDYPYPYVIGRHCWEFPCAVPSDWEAFNTHGSKNPRTTEDWKAALDAIVVKRGVMTMVLHPHGWSDPQQIVDLIDHAVAKHGRKVKFLNMREALERLEKHALAGQSLRSPENGGDNGVRLLDVNADGYMDVVIGNEKTSITRVWDAKANRWNECKTPTPFTLQAQVAGRSEMHVQFGITQADRSATMLVKGHMTGAWVFGSGEWKESPDLLRGLGEVSTGKRGIDGGVRLRDFDNDGLCELLVSNASQNAILRWSQSKRTWEPAPYLLPKGVTLVDADGRDGGLRFIDLNADGFDDVLFSNAQRYAIHLWARNVRPDLGWTPGWSHVVRAGERKGAANEPPPIVRDGSRRNNGAWFKDGHMVVQNEDTAKLEGVVDRRSFADLIAFDTPPPLSPEESCVKIHVRPGFTVELVAAEPLVIDPIAFEWDARGHLWVVEMRDYPLGVDGKGKSGGVIKKLEDRDGDGSYDHATAFLEDVPFPTGVFPWHNGVLVCAAPDILYAEDTNGDGRADIRRALFTGFKPGNQQHRANGFEWGLDGWIYGANGDSGGEIKCVAAIDGNSPDNNAKPVNISGRDFRFRPDTGEFEAISGATQYGRRRDDWGNWFGNNNPTWLWHYTVEDHYLRRNPKLAVKSVRKVLANYNDSTRVFPRSHQPIRFNQPQSLGHVTSACSPSPYRDELFGPEFADNVFICEPVHNVVHREVLVRDGATFTSRRPDDERDREFLASEDVWFRPTMVKTGPDGALYVADMYRFVLEHPEWIAPEAQARLNLRAGEDRGRIYRVRPANAQLRPRVDLTKLNTPELVAAMDSPNGWQRDTVQRLLRERKDHSAAGLIGPFVTNAKNPKVRAQTVATFGVMGATAPDQLIAALRDPHPGVRIAALRASEPLHAFVELQRAAFALQTDPDFTVRHQLALTVGAWPKSPEIEQLLTRLAERDGESADMRIAILSSVTPDHQLMKTLREERPKKPSAPAAPPIINAADPNRTKVIASFAGIDQLRPNPQRGREVFNQVCAVCHRFKGEGRELGPDLAMVAAKPNDWLLAAIFDPNQAVETRYQAQHIAMKEGAEWIGLVVSETGNNLTLRTADGSEHAILRTDIRETKPLSRSLMPEGLEGALKPQDLADLLAYLRTL